MGLMDLVRGVMGGGAAAGAPPAAPQPLPQKTRPGDVVPKDIGGDKPIPDMERIEALPEAPDVTLDETQQREMRDTVRHFLAQTDFSRRMALRRVLRGREYFAGRMGLVWDDGLLSYQPISNVKLGDYDLADEEDEFADTVLQWNIYQATVLYITAAMTSARANIRWYPQNPELDVDLQTASSSNDIIDLFDRVNNVDQLRNKKAQLLCTDGVWYAYVRHVKDGQRFGYHLQQVTQNVDTEIKPAGLMCQNCGQETPLEQAMPMIASGGLACQSCGAPLDPSNISPPMTAPVPQVMGTVKVPNGAELQDVYGVTEVRCPSEANTVAECSFICLQTETDKEYLMALYGDDTMYPGVKDKIQAGTTLSENSLNEERLARLSLKSGTTPTGATAGPIDGMNEKVTFTRIWLRPYTFYKIKDDVERQKYLDMFPRGIFMAFAGDVFCEARSESMDDFWVECHAYEGDGMIRPSICEILLDPQDALNDLMDSITNAVRHAVPFTLINEDLISGTNFRQSKARGGELYPVQLKDDKSMGEQVFSTSTPALPAESSALRDWIFGAGSQWLTGTLPGMTGQGDPDLKTARAYAQAKEQALGRLGIPWKNMQAAEVKIAQLAVRHFIDNRDTDVSFPDKSPIGFQNRTIKLSSLQGQATAFAENADTYPVSQGDRRDNLMQLAATGNPAINGAINSPENFAIVKTLNSLTGLKLPGEAAKTKQLREIQQLLADGLAGAGPVMPPPPPPVPLMGSLPGLPPGVGGALPSAPGTPMPPGVAGPAPGGMPVPPAPPQVPPGLPPPMLPPPPPEPQPSVPVDITDDHVNEGRAVQSWLQSDEAWEARNTNPAGLANVRLHGAAHMKMAMALAPPGPPQKG